MTIARTTMAGRGLASRAIYTFARSVVTMFVRTYTRARIDGRQHLPSGPYVLAPTHRSNYDTPVTAALTNRRLRFMGKHTLWKHRAIGWLLSAFGGFPVTRGTADREALRRCVEVLESGEALVMFPEGERKSGPDVHPLKDGAAYVAARAGVPIVPVGIGGTEGVMPVGSKFVYPRRVHVVIGAPLAVPGSEDGKVARSGIRDTTARLHVVLQRLFDEAQSSAGTPNRLGPGQSSEK
ncbi:MAG: 1-acyl-sn-glycerol-3-phosphate acyltransferase [Actinomycetota bacterium]|nr:1-acyl-sn-glycerol-3-phosphate acyltransferase [Actinomycetota bacterium]